MIQGRPAELLGLPYYDKLPCLPVQLDRSKFPDLLKLDLWNLVGLLPVTKEICDLCPDGLLHVQPNAEILDHYETQKTVFSMILIIINCHSFRLENGLLRGMPYSLTTMPARKRGEIEYSNAKAAAFFDFENMPTANCVFLQYDPFQGDWGLFAPFALAMGRGGLDVCYPDSVGFVCGTYFLASNFNRDDVVLPNLGDAPADIQRRYWRWRVNRYFSPFNDLRPRRVWGAESPIELFLMQGLGREDLFPTPQYLVFSNGQAYPSFLGMILEESRASETAVLTEIDLYLPQEKLAIFCDGSNYHRGTRSTEKDERIVDQLRSFGIRSVRVPGRMIVNELPRAIKLVLDALN